MSKKVQVVCYITVMIIALSATAVLFLMMPECGFCGRKLCFGTCQNDPLPDGDKVVEGIRENAPRTNQNTTRLVETPRADDNYMEKITFIGDSRTVALEFYGIPKERIFAENSLTHEQALTKNVVQLNEDRFTTIEEAVKVTAPDIILLNFGINGAAWMPDEEFMQSYEELVDQLLTAAPNSIIIIESILPVSVDYENRSDGIKNERIDELNNLLYEMAKRKGLYYMASNDALKNDRNALDSIYSDDGLHFKEAAYTELFEYIRTHAVFRE